MLLISHKCVIRAACTCLLTYDCIFRIDYHATAFEFDTCSCPECRISVLLNIHFHTVYYNIFVVSHYLSACIDITASIESQPLHSEYWDITWYRDFSAARNTQRTFTVVYSSIFPYGSNFVISLELNGVQFLGVDDVYWVDIFIRLYNDVSKSQGTRIVGVAYRSTLYGIKTVFFGNFFVIIGSYSLTSDFDVVIFCLQRHTPYRRYKGNSNRYKKLLHFCVKF